MSTNNDPLDREQRYATVLARYAGVLTERLVDEPPPIADRRYCLIQRSTIDGSLLVSLHDDRYQASECHLGHQYRDDWQIEELIDLDTGQRWDASYRVQWTRLAEPHPTASYFVSDSHALDRIALLLQTPAWHDASAVKDIAGIVATTGRGLSNDPAVTGEHR